MTNNPNTAWAVHHQEAALEQGWGIFWLDGRDPEIERYDEDPNSTFGSDKEALEFVILQAAKGDTLAIRALSMVVAHQFLTSTRKKNNGLTHDWH